MDFYKMHVCGYDYIVLDAPKINDLREFAVSICRRKTGIGAEGVIFCKEDTLEMLYFNAEGISINPDPTAIQCFSRYVVEKGYVKKKSFEVLTSAGTVKVSISNIKPFLSRVQLVKPSFVNGLLRVADSIDCFGRLLSVEDYRITIYSLFLGNIHTIVFVDDLDSNRIDLAPKIANHVLFRAQCDVEFVHVLDESNIHIKTYDSKQGFVQASGLGAAAAFVAAHRLGLVDSQSKVHFSDGTMTVEENKKGCSLESTVIISFIGQLKEDYIC